MSKEICTEQTNKCEKCNFFANLISKQFLYTGFLAGFNRIMTFLRFLKSEKIFSSQVSFVQLLAPRRITLLGHEIHFY